MREGFKLVLCVGATVVERGAGLAAYRGDDALDQLVADVDALLRVPAVNLVTVYFDGDVLGYVGRDGWRDVSPSERAWIDGMVAFDRARRSLRGV